MIGIASDHGGFELKNALTEYLKKAGVQVEDYGCFSAEACDYPEYAYILCDAVLSGECEKGILICGTGIGMSMAANRMSGIRAALCGDVFSAQATRQHNDANVLCLGARVTGEGLACMIAETFLKTEFSGEKRHVGRIRKIAAEYR